MEGVKLASSPSMAVTLGLQSIARIEIAKSTVNRKEMSMAELDQVDREIRHLSESPVQSAEGLEARLKILERLKTVLDGVDSRLDQAREMDSARDQERARQRAEQIEPFAQMEARLAARRQALEEGMTSLQLQLRAQNQFLKDAGEGSTSAPVDQGARDRN